MAFLGFHSRFTPGFLSVFGSGEGFETLDSDFDTGLLNLGREFELSDFGVFRLNSLLGLLFVPLFEELLFPFEFSLDALLGLLNLLGGL